MSQMRVPMSGILFVVALTAAVTTCDGAGKSILHDTGVNGTELCAEPVHRNGGPAAPLYNYASDGDDWRGLCKTGSSQSPIDLSINNASFVRPIQNTSHLITFGTIAATGNAVMRLEIDEVELISGNWNVTGLTIPVCGTSDVGCLRSENATSVQYITPNISNLHFHANSEHTREGLYYGAEAHLVANMSVNGKYHTIVFGVWMDLSGNQTNQFYSQLEPYIDNGSGQGCTPVDNVTFNVDTLFPSNKSYYAYSGSLTTPPCTEDVFWIVFTTPVKISVPQVKSLYEASAHINQPCAPGSTNQICNVMGSRTNNRPLQPINGRTVSLGKIDSNVANT